MTIRTHPVNDYASVVDHDTQLVDVRQPSEVAEHGIVGAINIPLDQLPLRIGELDAHRRTVLLCRSGNRSGQAAEFLERAGFDDLVNLEGGMLAYSGGESS